MLKQCAFVTLIFLLAAAAQAQVVTHIKDQMATVMIPAGQSIAVGETVQFLDESLNVVAQGVIEKTSPQGRSAIVRVTSGNVIAGQSFELKAGSQPPPPPPPPPPPGTPAYYPAGQQLSAEDQAILDRGEIGTTAYVIGGVLGTYPIGFGVGHAIQGRYSDKGWIFTVGELASVLVLINGIEACTSSSDWNRYGDCNDNGAVSLGALGFVGFRIWEIIDLWATPPEHNRRYHELLARTGRSSWLPIIYKEKNNTLLGLNYSF